MSLLIPEGDNLVTYYILPLVGVNKNSFGNSYKTSYLNVSGDTVYVELSKNMVVPSYKSSANYSTELAINGVLYVLFHIPTYFFPDVRYFIRGDYSKMSNEAKKIIYTTSTLPYNKTIGSFSMSHPILQALDKTKTLRVFLSDYLDIKPLPDSVELICSPDPWWFIESKFKQPEKKKTRNK